MDHVMDRIEELLAESEIRLDLMKKALTIRSLYPWYSFRERRGYMKEAFWQRDVVTRIMAEVERLREAVSCDEG